MLHGRDTHLFTRTTDPMTLTCRGLHLNAYGRHSAVRFSHQQHLHLPCLPPKNPPSCLKLTKISLPARTSFVVRTYILTPALSPTNSAFRCTWQQVLLTFPPLSTSPRLCGPSASLTTYVAPASHSQSGSAVGCSSLARTRVTRAMTMFGGCLLQVFATGTSMGMSVSVTGLKDRRLERPPCAHQVTLPNTRV